MAVFSCNGEGLMSIRIRFLLLIGTLSLLVTIGIAYASYQFTFNNAEHEANTKGKLVHDYIDAQQQFFKQHMRPKVFKISPKDLFIPELMSGFTVTRGVSDEFHKTNPDYVFKQASLDPLHLANKADKDDLKIINTFKKQPTMTLDEGSIIKDGQSYYYYAKPIKIESQKCLRCHGDPANAPREQIEAYGTEHGYNWKLGDLASAYIVYVPLEKSIAQAKKSAINLVLIGVVSIAVMVLILWVFFSMYVIKPLVMLEQRATQISLGENLDKTIATSSNDEIGSLARSVDRLRISVDKMLKRFKK
jgi:HAMP domain-containing protein